VTIGEVNPAQSPGALPEPMQAYDMSLSARGGEALCALLAEWDLEGLVVEVLLRGVMLRPETLAAIQERAPDLGITVADVRARRA
jgi:hypothetical protein